MKPFSWGKRSDVNGDAAGVGADENSEQNERMNTENTTSENPAHDPADQDAVDNSADNVIRPDDEAVGEVGAEGTVDVVDDDLEARVKELDGELLLARADAQNIQRRAKEELARANRYGAKRLATKMLDVRDSLERGLQVDIQEATPESLAQMREGMELTLKQFDSAMDSNSVAIIDPAPGDKLDPSLHQAMGMTPSEDIAPNHIAMVVQKGYQLHDQLLRPAMVMVATAAPASGPDGSGDDSTNSEHADPSNSEPGTDKT